MKKIIVNAADHKSPEVFHNDGIMHGMYSVDYKVLLATEAKIAHRFLDIALTGKLPKLVEISFKKRKDVKPEVINDIKVVSSKVASLMAEGFHGKIIYGMLACASGHGGGLSSDFQVKFEAAMDKGVRKDFWGTESRFALVVAEDLMYDLLKKEIDVDNPTDEDFENSCFYKEFVTDYLELRK